MNPNHGTPRAASQSQSQSPNATETIVLGTRAAAVFAPWIVWGQAVLVAVAIGGCDRKKDPSCDDAARQVAAVVAAGDSAVQAQVAARYLEACRAGKLSKPEIRCAAAVRSEDDLVRCHRGAGKGEGERASCQVAAANLVRCEGKTGDEAAAYAAEWTRACRLEGFSPDLIDCLASAADRTALAACGSGGAPRDEAPLAPSDGRERAADAGAAGGVEGGVAGDGVHVPVAWLERVSGETDIAPPAEVTKAMQREAKRRIIATIKLCLDSSGVPTSTRVVQSSGYAAYDYRIEDGMRKWRYRPYQAEGKAVPVCSNVTFVFQLED